MNSKNSNKISDSNGLLLNAIDKAVLRRGDKYIAFSKLNIYYTWKNMKKSYKSNTFKTSGAIWNKEFELLDWSYYFLGIQNYFEYIAKKHGEKRVNPSIRIYINKIGNRITFKIKSGCYHDLLSPGTMKLHGSTKSKITKAESGENLPYLEITEVVLTHFNVVNNSCQHNSRVLYKFVPNKLFGQLLNISSKNFMFSKHFESEFSYTEVWLTDQTSNSLEIEEKISITLAIN